MNPLKYSNYSRCILWSTRIYAYCRTTNVKGLKNLLVLIALRVNLEKDPEYDIVSILQYKSQLTEKVKLYSRLQLLNLFGSNGNIKSYQWVRLGLDFKGTQFGLAADFDEFGPHAKLEYNFGLFIRREIF